MLNDEAINKVGDRLANRIDNLNTYIIKKIGETIKEIGKLTPTQAMQLENILKYGGSFEKITNEIAKVSKMNVKDIYKIYEEVAKQDQRFASTFYKYRNIDYIPYQYNTALQNEVNSLAKMTAGEFINFSDTTALGYGFVNEKTGKITYKGLKQAYYDIIDEGILAISQGKETFDQRMSKIIKDIGESGLKVIYENGYARRLDSTVRMNLQEGVRQLHNELQEIFGNEYGADGIEITVHANSAPDHEPVQGRQFSTIKVDGELSEWEKLQDGEEAKDYKGNTYSLDHDNKNGYRPISTMNCYHYTYNVVLGISNPLYTEEQLNKLKEKNNKGFEYDGKHYTLYEGEQLQRKIELELRKQKDIQVMSRASGEREAAEKAQVKINALTKKYNDVLKASKLPSQIQRAKISGYRKIKV